MPSTPQPFPHVSIRGRIYYYQRRVPTSVTALPTAFQLHFGGRALYRKSLNTGVYAEALSRAAAAEIEFDATVAVATGRGRIVAGGSVSMAAHTSRRLDAAALADVSRSIRDHLVQDWRHDIIAAEASPDMKNYLDWRLDRVVAASEKETDDGLRLCGDSVAERAMRLNVSLNFCLDTESYQFAELSRAVRDGLVSARQDINSLLTGKSLPDSSTSTLINKFASNPTKHDLQPKISEVAVEQFRVKNFAPKTIEKYRRAYERFVDLVGDKCVDEVVYDDIHRFLTSITARQVGGASGAARPVSMATVQSYLGAISSLLAMAKRKRWRTGDNPASQIDLKDWVVAPDPKLRPVKRRFREKELNALFAHPWFAGCESSRQSYRPGDTLLDDTRYWAPVVALYTGARVAELGGLKLNEIVFDQFPHILIKPNEYRRTKSGNSRIVPVVDALLELGFAAYIERVSTNGNDRLFPDWECPRNRGQSESGELSRWSNSKWVRAFNRMVVPSVFPRDSHELRSAVTLHSLRGSFKKLLEDHGGGKEANSIMGHIHDDLDKRYLGLSSPEELHEKFKAIRYKAVIIPSRLHSTALPVA